MPELPEVETVKNTLIPLLTNKTIKSVEVLKPNLVKSNLDEYVKTLVGKTFLSISRIGKFLIFHLSTNYVIVSHLRMEGKYYLLKENEPNSRFARIIYHLNNEEKLCYDDSRQFGIAILSRENDYLNLKEISKLGKEPFYLTKKELYAILHTKNLPIKSVLLDQSVIAGLGNIYVDEVLFKCHINPETTAKCLSINDAENIIKNSVATLNEAIIDGGSTIKSYHPASGIDGSFQTHLQCYGKSGTPCPICGTILLKTTVGGRGTTYCPHCQKKIGGKIIIGVTGLVGSGKSAVLKEIAKNNIPTLSCDDVVHDLYRKNEMIDRINLAFNFTEKYIDGVKLLKLIAANKKERVKLEKIIHPAVKKEVNRWIKKQKTKVCAIEIPLLFNANMDKMCTYIIGVTLDYKTQLVRLIGRKEKYLYELLELGSSNTFKDHLDQVTYLIDNSGTYDELMKKTKDVINDIKCKENI